MPRAYIAAPFSSKMTNKKHGEYGEVNDPDYRKFLEDIEAVVKAAGFETFLPHREIGFWGTIPNLTLEDCCVRYFEEISDADIFVGYPEKSRGVHIELGWALANKKRIVLLMRDGFDLGTVIPGLSAVADVEIINFSDFEDMKAKLKAHLQKMNVQ